MSTPVTNWIDVDGAQLAAYFTAAAPGSSGAPLVFLHAGVTDHRLWQAQMAAFAPEHAVLTYDRRGFGQTRTLRATPYARTADLWAAMDAAGLERTVLVGCSQGGRVALDAVLERPERVLGLVLVAPSVSGVPIPPLTGRTKQLADDSDAATAAGNLAAANELDAALWLDGPGSPVGRVGGEARALFLAMNDIALHATDPGTVLEAEPAWPRLEQIKAPTLVLWGNLDLPHLQERGELLVKRIAGAQRAVMSGAAHLPSLEAPEAFNEVLRAFLLKLA